MPIEEVPEAIQEEMLSQKMEQEAVIVEVAEEKAPDFTFSIKTPQQPKTKGFPSNCENI